MGGLAWRLLGREWRSGELRLLALALVVAVAAVSAVGFFTDRVRQALEREALQLLGGDLLLISDHDWSAEVRQAALERGLRLAETRVFPSMVVAGERSQLADIKAVSPHYPLRGQLRIAGASGAPDAPAGRAPASGTVWLDERLASALTAGVGDTVTVGSSRLRVDAILTLEPDRGINIFSVAPRLMLALDDLAATGLVQIGSRVTYRLLLAGEAERVDNFRNWLTPRLGRGERVEDIHNARPEIRNALERGQRFLGLATLLTVVLAAVAMSLAARRYLQRHLDACAILRCLGATQKRLIGLHVGLFAWLALLAAAVGCALGFAAHFILYSWLVDLLGIPLPPPSWLPLAQAALTAAVLLFGFALPPILRLTQVPTLRVMRRELGPPSAGFIGGHLFGLLCLAGLMLWVAGDLKLGSWAVAGLAGAAIVFVTIARAGVWLLGRVRRGGWFGWRQGLANLERHAWASSLQIVALALGILAMLLLTVTRGELLSAWQKATPIDAPNRFIINILQDQVKPLCDEFSGAGIDVQPAPMVRGRLLRINDKPVNAGSFPDDDRAQRLVEREFNLSWRADLPPGNTITAGRWFESGETGQGVASVEEGLARTLGVGVGDRLEFAVSGEPVGVTVVGLRKLDWDSMRVNFFVLTPPGVIDRYPASSILSVYLPPGKESVTHRLVARFPNLTVIDVGAILDQLRKVIGHIAQAVQFIFVFTLLAGVVVLYAAQMTAFDERRYELAVIRALGAQRHQLRQALLTEMAAIGALAGLIAAAGALAVGQLLAAKAFQIEMSPDWWLLPASALAGALFSAGIGWLGIRLLLQTPPNLVLREGV